MTAKRLMDFLDREGVRYVTIAHSPAYTAGDTAQVAHIQEKDFAKTVIVAKSLAADEQIAFNAGSHEELVRTAYKDFERLVQPIVATLSTVSRPAGKVESA